MAVKSVEDSPMPWKYVSEVFNTKASLHCGHRQITILRHNRAEEGVTNEHWEIYCDGVYFLHQICQYNHTDDCTKDSTDAACNSFIGTDSGTQFPFSK